MSTGSTFAFRASYKKAWTPRLQKKQQQHKKTPRHQQVL
jgi:hypothetical protein